MQNRETYEYAVIRFVPKVEREEFINIGVILFSKRKNFLDMKFHIDKDKIQAFSEKVDLHEITDYMQGWKDVCSGVPKGGVIGKMELASRFRWLVASRSTIIQSSNTHSGLCEDPAIELQKAFTRFVL